MANTTLAAWTQTWTTKVATQLTVPPRCRNKDSLIFILSTRSYITCHRATQATIVKKTFVPSDKMSPEPEQREITDGNFGLEVIARRANVARRPTLLSLLRRFWVVLAGSLLVLAVALMWSSSVANEPLSPAVSTPKGHGSASFSPAAF